MTKRVYLPKPLPHQIPVLGSSARLKVVCCGRRWGKSKAGLLACVEGHGPPGCHKGAMEGGEIWWVAPSFPVASMIWRDLKHALRDAWSAKNEVDRRIELGSGGSISVRSADNPDSLRGVGLDGVVIDEAAFCQQETWTEAMRPALADKQGWAMFISTPSGQNWFYDLWNRAQTIDDMEAWQRPTSDNPIIPPSELEAAKLELGPFTFSQEFDAQFVSPEGALFKRDDIEIVDSRVTRIAARVRCWDLAASLTGKRTAGLLLAKTPQPYTYVVEDVVKGRWLPGDRDKIIRQTAEADGSQIPIRIEQEPGSGGVAQIHAIVSAMAGFDVKGVRVTGDKITRADPVAAQAGIGRLKAVRGDWLGDFLSEIETFPSGKFLDQIDALSLAFDFLKDRAPGRSIADWTPKENAEDWRNEIDITDTIFSRLDWRSTFPE